MPNSGAHPEADNHEEVVLDFGLVGAVIKRRWVSLLALVLIWGVICALLMLFAVPQSYSSSISVALQQPTQSMTSLTSLFGGMSSSTARYLGILHSDRLAKEVEHVIHLQQIDDLRSKQEAIERIRKGLQVENSATDGLLYIRFSLNGPPRLMPGSSEKRSRIKRATVLAANAYGAALRRYMQYSDTDKDAILLREADKKLREARSDYDHSVDQLIEFVRHAPTSVSTSDTSGGAGSSGGSGGSGSGSVNAALMQLQQLYLRRGQLEVSIKSAEAGKTSVGALLDHPAEDLAQMPTEDPLLSDARQQVSDAQVNLKNLLAQYADGNPRVVVARERLKIATDHLQSQVDALKAGRSTNQVKLDQLNAEYDDVLQQLKKAEADFVTSRNLTAQYERLHTEVQIRLEVLKTVFTRYAELSLQTVATQNRMLIVDDAQLPRQGSPGMPVIVVVSAITGLLAAGIRLVRDVTRANAARA